MQEKPQQNAENECPELSDRLKGAIDFALPVVLGLSPKNGHRPSDRLHAFISTLGRHSTAHDYRRDPKTAELLSTGVKPLVLLSVIALLRRRSGRPLCGDTGALGLQNEGQAALDAVPSGTNRRERGAMLIEAAVVFPVLLITSLLAIELLWVSYVALTTQFTAARVLRQASVGPEVFAVPPHTASATPFESYITQSFLEISQELLVSIQPEQISIECVPAVRCPTTAGIPGATVKLEVNRPTRVLFWGSIVVQGIAMGRNERWRS